MAGPRTDRHGAHFDYHCGLLGLIVCSIYGLYLIALDRGRVRDLEEKQELVLDAYRRTRDHLSYIPEDTVHEVRTLYLLDLAAGETDIFGPDPKANRTLRLPVRHIVVLLETIEALDGLQRRLRWILHQP